MTRNTRATQEYIYVICRLGGPMTRYTRATHEYISLVSMTRNKRAKHEYISFFKQVPWFGCKMQLITHKAPDQKITLFRHLSNQ